MKRLRIFNGLKYIGSFWYDSKEESEDHTWYIINNNYVFVLWNDSGLILEEADEPKLYTTS